MKQGSGLPVFSGVAIGPAVVYRRAERSSIACGQDPAEEQKKFDLAREIARRQLDVIYDQALQDLGEENAAIVDVQRLMLDDPDFLEEVGSTIASGIPAAQAAIDCGEEFARMFASLDDEYMQARGADIRDVSRRINDILCGNTGLQLPEGKFLLVAEDLGPSETIQLPRERILAFVTREGSAGSHTAILARILNIPSLVQADLQLETAENCTCLAVDGFTGTWYTDPDGKTLDMLHRKRAQAALDRQALEAYRHRESVTKGGKKVLLCANIGCPEDTELAIREDCEGIGLMRSEFLYLGRETMPTEEELFRAYKKVAEAMEGRPVVVRTLDLGADKQAPYMDLQAEENPALGLRGIRTCLTREDIFVPQLRAIYRASAYGNIRIMFPMITSLWEFRAARAICRQVEGDLKAEGIPIGHVPVGMMVETPAAALQAKEFAQEADFFSVGTNDLTQYTLAVDRQNAQMGEFYDSHHPALLKLLQYVADCAGEAGIWAGICGELGSDPSLTETFLQMGYQGLSMAPGKILEIRRIVCESEVTA